MFKLDLQKAEEPEFKLPTSAGSWKKQESSRKISILLYWLCQSLWLCSVQFSSVAQSCPTLCDPMNRSTPGLPVHHQIPEFIQTHVHQVRDAIQPSHPLLFPSPPAPNPSQHHSLFQWINSSHEVSRVLEFHHVLFDNWVTATFSNMLNTGSKICLGPLSIVPLFHCCSNFSFTLEETSWHA